MHFRLVFEEIVSTMYCRGVGELVSQEGPEGKDMTPQNLRWQSDRKRIGHYVFDGMGVLRCQCDGCCEFMMPLMDSGVEEWTVKKTVTVIEERLSQKNTQDEVTKEFGQGWQRGLDSKC